MVNALGESKKERGKGLRVLLILGTSLFLFALVTAAFFIASEYRLNPAWVFGILSAVAFLVVVGRGYRNKFRSPAFVIYFVAWLLTHVAIYLLVLTYLGLAYYLPILILELWVGYLFAIWRFGPPSRRPQ